MRQPSDELAELDERGLRRNLSLRSEALIDFASNDYLGLANHPRLAQAAVSAIETYGVGSRSARLISGTHAPHRELEEKLAEAKNTQASLVFSTGYATALGTLTALAQKGDTLILDKLCHASLIDGARLSGATLRVYPHNHLEKLERLLKAHPPTQNSRTIVVTESIFSMDGDRAQLLDIIELKEKYGAWLLLDEAHAFGLYGKTGTGLAEELHVRDRVDLHMGTLSKAAGVSGGYLAANRDTIDLVLNTARSFIYSTAPLPAQAAAACSALDLIRSAEGEALRKRLAHNIEHFSQLIGSHQDSAIHPVIIGDNHAALARAEELKEQGFSVPAIRYPTVPKLTARLRISLSAGHKTDDIELLGRAIATFQKESPD